MRDALDQAEAASHQLGFLSFTTVTHTAGSVCDLGPMCSLVWLLSQSGFPRSRSQDMALSAWSLFEKGTQKASVEEWRREGGKGRQPA